MSKRVKPEGQDIMSWLDDLAKGDPEAQAAYEDEMSKHTWVPKSRLAALELLALAAYKYSQTAEKCITTLVHDGDAGERVRAIRKAQAHYADLQNRFMYLQDHESVDRLQNINYVFDLEAAYEDEPS